MKHEVREELNRIAKRDGILTQEAVVAEAKKKNNPLHSEFEWDDTKAGAEYRLLQAAQMIRAHVTMVDNGESKAPIRTFVSLSSDRTSGGGYRPMTEVMASEEMKRILLADAERDFKALHNKYRTLAELSSVWQEVEKVFRKSVAA